MCGRIYAGGLAQQRRQKLCARMGLVRGGNGRCRRSQCASVLYQTPCVYRFYVRTHTLFYGIWRNDDARGSRAVHAIARTAHEDHSSSSLFIIAFLSTCVQFYTFLFFIYTSLNDIYTFIFACIICDFEKKKINYQ